MPVRPHIEGPGGDHPVEYPPAQGSGPNAPNYGYPFHVQGPTQPGGAPGVPYEYQRPYIKPGIDINYPAGYDPTYGGPPPWSKIAYPQMPRDPFNTLAQDQETEFAWGEGMFPDPILDYSGGGSRSRFPIANPDKTDQLRNLAAIKRTDLSDPFAPANPYVAGNTDRFGKQPPLVRKKGRYKKGEYHRPRPPRMVREW